MRKKCENCGREFEAIQPHFKVCPDCFSFHKPRRSDISELLLKAYYNEENNLLKEVFIGVPEELARIFAYSKPPLATKQLRDFHLVILRARNKALIQGIDIARSILWECRRNVAYHLKRGIIPRSFKDFLEHHLALAEGNERMLDGFCQHLESIVAYFPKEKGGQK